MARVTGRSHLPQAIGMLRVQQQSTDSVKILTELELIRQKISNTNSEVDNARQELNTSKTRLQTTESKIVDHETRLQDLLSHLKHIRDELEDLKRLHQDRRQTLAGNREPERLLLDKIGRDVASLTNRLTNVEDRGRAASKEVRKLLDSKAGHEHIEEVQQKLNELVLDIEKRLLSQHSTSHVTNTPDRGTRRLQDLQNSRTPTYLEPVLQPVVGGFSQRGRKTQETNNFDTAHVSFQPIPPPAQQYEPHSVQRSSSHVSPELMSNTGSAYIEQTEDPFAQQAGNHVRADPNRSCGMTQVSTTNEAIDASMLRPSTTSQREGENMSGDDEYRAICKALYELVSLKQDTTQSLGKYYNALAVLARELPEKPDIEGIYLRKFINGIKDDTERGFAIKWLEKSEWTLQDIRECIVLLTSVLPNGKRLLPPELLIELTQAQSGMDVPLPSVEDVANETPTRPQQSTSASSFSAQQCFTASETRLDEHGLGYQVRPPCPGTRLPVVTDQTFASSDAMHEEHEITESGTKSTQAPPINAPARPTACKHHCKDRNRCRHKCCKTRLPVQVDRVTPQKPRRNLHTTNLRPTAETSPLSELTHTPSPPKPAARQTAAALARSLVPDSQRNQMRHSSPYFGVPEGVKRRKV